MRIVETQRELFHHNEFLNDIFLEKYAGNLKALKSIWIMGPYITDNGLKGLTKIQVLRLYGAENVTVDVFRFLPELRYLDLYDNEKITNEGLSGCEALRTLKLEGNAVIRDYGIKRLTMLTTLELNDNITNDGISSLTNLTCLIGNRKISDRGVERLIKLRLLTLPQDSWVTYDGIKNLKWLKRLKLIKYDHHHGEKHKFSEEDIEALKTKGVEFLVILRH